MTFEELKELAQELYDHLQYCNWGDSWERGAADELRDRADVVFYRKPFELLPYQCEKCEEAFRGPEELFRHRKNTHSVSCYVCKASCSSPKNAGRHFRQYHLESK